MTTRPPSEVSAALREMTIGTVTLTKINLRDEAADTIDRLTRELSEAQEAWNKERTALADENEALEAEQEATERELYEARAALVTAEGERDDARKCLYKSLRLEGDAESSCRKHAEALVRANEKFVMHTAEVSAWLSLLAQELGDISPDATLTVKDACEQILQRASRLSAERKAERAALQLLDRVVAEYGSKEALVAYLATLVMQGQ